MLVLAQIIKPDLSVGEIRVGDQLMMVNGWNLVDITIGEARKLLVKAMNDHKVSG